jgi:hypothetical protein
MLPPKFRAFASGSFDKSVFSLNLKNARFNFQSAGNFGSSLHRANPSLEEMPA